MSAGVKCIASFAFIQRLAVIDTDLGRVTEDVKQLNANVSRHEGQISDLRERVARLEESRHTIRAEVEVELLKAVRQIERNTEAQLQTMRRALPATSKARKTG